MTLPWTRRRASNPPLARRVPSTSQRSPLFLLPVGHYCCRLSGCTKLNIAPPSVVPLCGALSPVLGSSLVSAVYRLSPSILWAWLPESRTLPNSSTLAQICSVPEASVSVYPLRTPISIPYYAALGDIPGIITTHARPSSSRTSSSVALHASLPPPGPTHYARLT